MDEDAARARTLHDAIIPYLTTLLFLSGNKSEDYRVKANGTATFLDTGRAKLLVTNAHVLHTFDDKAAADPQLSLVVGGQGLCASIHREWLKACASKENSRPDLATFQLPGDFDISRFGKQFFKQDSWPPKRVQAGQDVVIGGFPGDHLEKGIDKVTASLTTLVDVVSSVADVSFTLADENKERKLVQLNPNLVYRGQYGGMSGSPTFRFSEGVPELVGFLSETHEGLHAIIRVIHSDFVSADGQLDISKLVI